MIFADFDACGRVVVTDDTEGMSYPMRCTRCDRIHDAGKVEVIARHADCSVWRCPNCRATIDDRPDGYGGAVKVGRR